MAGDIVPKQGLAGTRRRIVQLDQSSAADLDRLCTDHGPFEIIIDDGSHFNAHQILTFQHLWGSLKEGGVYVVEDVQTSFWPGVVAGVEWDGADIEDAAFSKTCYGYFLDLAKYVNHAEFSPTARIDPELLGIARQVKHIAFEHNLIVLKKGENNEKSAFVQQTVPAIDQRITGIADRTSNALQTTLTANQSRRTAAGYRDRIAGDIDFATFGIVLVELAGTHAPLTRVSKAANPPPYGANRIEGITFSPIRLPRNQPCSDQHDSIAGGADR